MHCPRPTIVLLLSVLCAFAGPVAAQWSKDGGPDALLSSGAGSAAQPLVAADSSGAVWVSWFDNNPAGSPAFGFDVRVQRLDPAGRELFAPGGVLVADRGFSSTQAYGFDVGPDGSAWLAFRDDRVGGVQITVARVEPDGALSFGAGGVQLTNTSAFLASPRVAATTDGQADVAWTEGSSVRVQRVAADGTPLLGNGILLPTAGSATNSVADLRASDAGSAILSWVGQTGGFFGPRQLFAQKLDAAGAPQWGALPVTIFDAGSLQIGNFPEFASDGAGGAVFAWYGVSPPQSYVQRVGADGSLAFGANGTEVALDPSRVRVSPSVRFDPATGRTVVAWVEQNSTQSQSGVYVQEFDAAGARVLGANGLELVPVSPESVTDIEVLAAGGERVVQWIASPSFGADRVRALRLDASGASLHGIIELDAGPTQKGRLDSEFGPLGDVVAAWQDDASGSDEVSARNLLPSGVRGPAAGALARTAGSNLPSLSGQVGPLGGSLDLVLDVGSTGHAFGFVFAARQPAEVPLAAGQFLLVDLGLPELLNQLPAPGPLASFSIAIPNLPALCGRSIAAQGAHVDVALPLELSNALDVYLGL